MKKKEPLMQRVERLGHEPRIARGLILSGRVIVNGRKETRTGLAVDEEAKIEIIPERFSRAASKLQGALERCRPNIAGRICADLGASHGGFTRTLLDWGAARVYAVDVAYGMIAHDLRIDERVTLLERRNARELTSDWFAPEDLKRPDGLFITCDLSFISLKSILVPVAKLAERTAGPLDGIFLLKPQFEASRMTEKGILKDEHVRRQIIDDMIEFAQKLGFTVKDEAPAAVPGAGGNQEHILYLAAMTPTGHNG